MKTDQIDHVWKNLIKTNSFSSELMNFDAQSNPTKNVEFFTN